MSQTKTNLPTIKLYSIFFFFWATGVILSLFWGLGWFFLLETFRRLLTYLPPINNYIRKLVVGRYEPTNLEVDSTNPNLVKLSRVLKIVILLIWIGMTIFVFMKINIPLIRIFGISPP
jgi:hypothetical protein